MAMTTQISIPGLELRPFDPVRDVPALVELIVDAHLHDGIDWLPTEESLRVEFAHLPEFDPRRDVRLAWVDDTLVAATETHVRMREGVAVHHLEGWVRPSWRQRGLGRRLLEWAEARAREVAAVDGRTCPRALSAWPDETQAGAVALYAAAGYEVIRATFLMIRDLTAPIADEPLPEGLEVRSVRPADHRRIWDADVEAFRDHWGRVERTEADYQGWFANPDLDTRLWQVAWDGDEVAGSVMTFIYTKENEALGVARGSLDHVSVRRSWRKRGLASALITRSLLDLRGRGMQEAVLGVDAENVTGARRLYERLGFRRARTDLCFRKELAPR